MCSVERGTQRCGRWREVPLSDISEALEELIQFLLGFSNELLEIFHARLHFVKYIVVVSLELAPFYLFAQSPEQLEEARELLSRVDNIGFACLLTSQP